MNDKTIENKQQFFATKEDYLAMRKAWATYFNTEARKLERNEYGNKIRKLNHSHFILYAILRGKDWKQLDEKCEAGSYLPRWEYAHNLRKPFGETLTEQMYAQAKAIYERGYF